MLALFVTVVCERCDTSPRAQSHDRRGYIVWRSRPPGSTEYVFRNRDGAATWRASAYLGHFPIRAVVGSSAFQWRTSTGSVAGVELAEGVYEVYPDAHHPPTSRSVHLDPDQSA